MGESAGLRARARSVLRSALDARLKRHGYRKQGELYRRDAGAVTQLIDVQYSRWNDGSEMSFTLNCGVHVPGVASAFRGGAEPARPSFADCCITVRAGMLTESRLDAWWKVTAEDDAATADAVTAMQIGTMVDETLLPFLQRFEDERSVAHFLASEREERDRFVEPRADGLRLAYAAILWRRLGESKERARCLEAAVASARATPLEQTVRKFASRWA